MYIYETSSGWPPLLARHFREAKCGPHVHFVCPQVGPHAGFCLPHVDRHNPDCDGEFVDHMQHDFWQTYKDPIVVGAVLLGVALLLVL